MSRALHEKVFFTPKQCTIAAEFARHFFLGCFWVLHLLQHMHCAVYKQDEQNSHVMDCYMGLLAPRRSTCSLISLSLSDPGV